MHMLSFRRQRRPWSPITRRSFIFLPSTSPSLPLPPSSSLHFLHPCVWYLQNQTSLCERQKPPRRSATRQLAVGGVRRLTISVHAEVIRSCQTGSCEVSSAMTESVLRVCASPTSQLWLQCGCAEGLFINKTMSDDCKSGGKMVV